jgi:hypothetical protein
MDEKDLNNFSKKLFENYRLHRPPEDFTDKVMLKIEQARIPQKQENSIFGKKFVVFFVLTFSSLITFGYVFGDKNSTSKTSFLEKLNLPEFNIDKLIKLFNFNFEIGLFAKLVIISVIVLIIIDLLTGSVIDYILDIKSKK